MRPDPLLEAILHGTAQSLRLASPSGDRIREVVDLYVRRASEAKLTSREALNLFATAGDCVLNRAALDPHGEAISLEALEVYSALVPEGGKRKERASRDA